MKLPTTIFSRSNYPNQVPSYTHEIYSLADLFNKDIHRTFIKEAVQRTAKFEFFTVRLQMNFLLVITPLQYISISLILTIQYGR